MAKSRKDSKRSRNKTTRLQQLEQKFQILKRDVLTIKLQSIRDNEVTLKFVSMMQLLKNKGLVTDEEITAQLDLNKESISQSRVQSESTRTDEGDSGSEKSDILGTPSNRSDPDVSSD